MSVLESKNEVLKPTSIVLTSLEHRLIKQYAAWRGVSVGRLAARAILAEANLWVYDNGFQEEWARLYEKECE